MKTCRLMCTLAALLLLSACASYSYSNADQVQTESKVQVAEKTDPAKIILTEGDITDRPYKVIGDLKVTVNKTTIFNKDPTREMVDVKFRKDASELGADAVILIRYGTVGIGLITWGSLDANGRAIKFTN